MSSKAAKRPEGALITLKFKKLNKKATIPRKMSAGAAGMDLTAVQVTATKEKVTINTGVAMQMPMGYVGLLFPRSSVTKTDLRLANCVGVIDSDYRGPIKVVFDRKGNRVYNVGDRVAQLVIVPIPHLDILEVDELDDTTRGSGGFGSTGV